MNENNIEEISKINEGNYNNSKMDIYPHIERNILDPNKNCKEQLNDKIYYCLDCKMSTCDQCSINDHKNHNKIKKKDYIFYNPSLFSDVEISLENTFNPDKAKEIYINELEKEIYILHSKLDEIKLKKIEEINNVFENAKKNIRELSGFVDCAKKEIKNFYLKYEKFFNIKNKNNDRDNTIFLIHYDLMSLCDKKNKEFIQGLNIMKKGYIRYGESFETQGNKIIKDIEEFLGLEEPKNKFDDFYWDFHSKINTYDDHINKVQKGLFDILKQTGDSSALREIIHILDSKNRKGIQFIFNKNYFSRQKGINDKANSKNERNENGSNTIKYECSNNFVSIDNDSITEPNSTKAGRIKKVRKNLCRSAILQRGLSNERKNKDRFIKYKSNNKYSTGVRLPSSSSRYDSLEKNNAKKRVFVPNSVIHKRTNDNDSFSNSMKKLGISSYKDIYLDDKIKQRYFTYSIKDLFNRLFSNQAKSYDNNEKIFVDYNERNSQLKEYIKPIINTSEITIYNRQEDKSKRIKLSLIRKKHGYDKFPPGCRHLYINNKLYICGGVDSLNFPLAICLVYDIKTNSIEKLDDMISPHTYHSMEYLDNYNSFLVIGGENNKVVELFDLFTNHWNRLPDLNIPRANVNIYFDPFTSELYTLFGLLGSISTKHNLNSEAIEVLELNDISSGWCKIDYYKGSSFDVRQEIVTTLPFTRNKLLIYGGKNVRDNSKLFGLYLINKMEIIKSDKELIEKIKYEQKKIKAINNIYSKMKQ